MIRLRQQQFLAVPNASAMITPVVMLLIIGMVFTPAHTHGYIVTAGSATAVGKGPVQIDVDSRGRFYLDDRPLTDADFEAALRIALRANTSSPGVVHLRADGNAPYDRVMHVLAAAGALGVRRAELLASCPHDRETLMRRCAPRRP